jgi:hypothetical protein
VSEVKTTLSDLSRIFQEISDLGGKMVASATKRVFDFGGSGGSY